LLNIAVVGALDRSINHETANRGVRRASGDEEGGVILTDDDVLKNCRELGQRGEAQGRVEMDSQAS
jgi:hypothetical protein